MRDTHYRMHRFRSTAVPVKGLTADMLVSDVLLGLAVPST